MIRAVFFDFYGTLARFDPPIDVVQTSVLEDLGFKCSRDGIRRGYVLADDFMARENEICPIFERTLENRSAFFTEYERIILDSMGIHAPPELAALVWGRVSQMPREFVLFDDVMETLQELRDRGMVIGIISNSNQDLGQLTRSLNIAQYLAFCIASREVGNTKPHPAIFHAALKKARVEASESVHVGDQYHSDVQGAQAVGIRPLLLDRDGLLGQPHNCQKLHSLRQVVLHIGSNDVSVTV